MDTIYACAEQHHFLAVPMAGPAIVKGVSAIQHFFIIFRYIGCVKFTVFKTSYFVCHFLVVLTSSGHINECNSKLQL